MTEAEEHGEPSLDQLSQAFAEAMGRSTPVASVESAQGPDGSEPSSSKLSEEQKETKPDDACPISPKSILEAILFVGHPENDPIADESIARLLRGVDVAEVAELVDILNQEYDAGGLPYRVVAEKLLAADAPTVEPVNTGVTGYRLQLRDEFDHLRENFYGRVREAQLSQLAVDVLAVVAYNQPVTRVEIDRLLDNGLDTGRVLNQLVRRDLLMRNSNDLAEKTKRKAYVTTDRFLEFFNLRDIGDLPHSEDPE